MLAISRWLVCFTAAVAHIPDAQTAQKKDSGVSKWYGAAGADESAAGRW